MWAGKNMTENAQAIQVSHHHHQLSLLCLRDSILFVGTWVANLHWKQAIHSWQQVHGLWEVYCSVCVARYSRVFDRLENQLSKRTTISNIECTSTNVLCSLSDEDDEEDEHEDNVNHHHHTQTKKKKKKKKNNNN